MSRYPISKACPRCGGNSYRAVNPDTWVAFAKDRVCNTCGVRYTPPTPVWGAVCLILVGLVLFLLPLSSILITIARMAAEPRSGAGSTLPVGPGTVIEVLLGVVGLVAMVHGVRALTGKQGAAPGPATAPTAPPPLPAAATSGPAADPPPASTSQG